VAQTTANADAVLKEFYLEPIREALNQKAVLMFAASDDEDGPSDTSDSNKANSFRGLARESEDIEFAGKEWNQPAHTSRNEGVGAIPEFGTLPVAGQQGWTNLKDTLKHNVGVIELSRYAIRLSEQRPGAFLKLLDGETKGLVKDIRKDVNRQGYGNGTGSLAAVVADGANTVTVDSVQFLRVNMRVDMVDSGTDAVLASNRTITAINASTKVVTYSGADVTATTSHRLCRTGSWKKEINGLSNLVSDTGTVHGVDSSLAQNEWHRSTVKIAGGAPFDEDTGHQVLDQVSDISNGEVDFIVTTSGIIRRYASQLKSMKRFNDAQSMTLRGGFEALLFNNMPMIKDVECPKGTMWFLNQDALNWVYLPNGNDPGNWDWVDDDGAILARKADRTDGFEGYLAADHDMAAVGRNELGKITGLEDDAAGTWK
jgi:hypothetical protein